MKTLQTENSTERRGNWSALKRLVIFAKCSVGIHSYSYYRDIGRENPVQDGRHGILFYSKKRCYCEHCGKNKKFKGGKFKSLPELLLKRI